MKKLLLATVLLTGSSAAAMASPWYGVQQFTGHCIPFTTNPTAWAASMRGMGFAITDKTEPSTDQYHVIELVANKQAEETGVVFVNDREFCEGIADLMKATQMMPYQIRDMMDKEVNKK